MRSTAKKVRFNGIITSERWHSHHSEAAARARGAESLRRYQRDRYTHRRAMYLFAMQVAVFAYGLLAFPKVLELVRWLAG